MPKFNFLPMMRQRMRLGPIHCFNASFTTDTMLTFDIDAQANAQYEQRFIHR